MDPSVHYLQHPLCDESNGRVVGDDDDGCTLLVETTEKKGKDLVPIGRVQIAHRFVGQDDPGMGNQSSGDSSPLLLFPAELCRVVLGPVNQVHLSKNTAASPMPSHTAKARKYRRCLELTGNGFYMVWRIVAVLDLSPLVLEYSIRYLQFTAGPHNLN